MSRPKIDITGRRYGRLTVLGEDPYDSRKVICKCDCGKTTSATKNNLRTGTTRSCGCLRAENASKQLPQFLDKAHEKMREITKMFGTNFSVIERKGPAKNNTSGHTGVSWLPAIGKYMAYLYFRGQRKYLGCYANYADAVAARERAEEEYYAPVIEAKNQYLRG